MLVEPTHDGLFCLFSQGIAGRVSRKKKEEGTEYQEGAKTKKILPRLFSKKTGKSIITPQICLHQKAEWRFLGMEPDASKHVVISKLG